MTEDIANLPWPSYRMMRRCTLNIREEFDNDLSEWNYEDAQWNSRGHLEAGEAFKKSAIQWANDWCESSAILETAERKD
jgi:hypothetical protein